LTGNASYTHSVWGMCKGFSIPTFFMVCLWVGLAPGKEPSVTERIAVHPFDLSQIRLLDSPFRHNMLRDAEYLLRLEPDRLLAGFRKEAGLPPKAAKYGGWEQRGVAGHSLGHYLSACSLMYASTQDERLKKRVEEIVEELALCQDALGTGYIGAIPDGKRVFAEIKAGEIRSRGFDLNGLWVPWYTLHKLFAGLLDAHEHVGSKKALVLAAKLGDWAIEITEALDEATFQRMLACEHGGINESFAELYGRTGEERYLIWSRKFHHRAVLDPLSRGEDQLQGLHANTQFPKVIGAARRYELTGDAEDKRIAEFFWDRVVHHHSYVTGGNSDHEHFGPPDQLDDRLSNQTTESCNTYNMLKLTRHVFSWSGSPECMDYYERALYNHILGSQNPEDGMMCYFVPLKSGEYKTYSTEFTTFSCCHGTGMENHAKYGESIYWRDEDSLYVTLFIPSVLSWAEKGITLQMETDFPRREEVKLCWSCEKKQDLAVKVRCPFWLADAPEVLLNGEALEISAEPGTFLEIRRTWRDGDELTVRLPMDLRRESMPDNEKRMAILYGPLLLAGDLGPIEERNVPQSFILDRGESLQEWVKPIEGEANRFSLKTGIHEEPIRLLPFHEMHFRRHAVYWDLYTEEEWRRLKEKLLVEEKRRKELEARTLDFLRVGEMQPERDHALKGEKTGAGQGLGRKWRHAVDGGWFSFEMAVSPEGPVDLLCTYWGGDVHNRLFDILVDGERIATQRLENEVPGHFFDAVYPIPLELTQGKKKVVVRLQAHPGMRAGGLFGCRTAKRDKASP